LLDFKLGYSTDVDLKSDLGTHGRDSGQTYLVNGACTLVLVTFSLEEAKVFRRVPNNGLVPEIRLRTAIGDYV
jgi:hypothetical protein